jgi:hypothetical protein
VPDALPPPEAATLKVTLAPAAIIGSCGCVLIAGNSGSRLIVRKTGVASRLFSILTELGQSGGRLGVASQGGALGRSPSPEHGKCPSSKLPASSLSGWYSDSASISIA